MRKASVPFFILAVCFSSGWMGYLVRPFSNYLAVLFGLVFYFSAGITMDGLSVGLKVAYFVCPLIVLLAGGTGAPGLFFLAIGASTLFLIGLSRKTGRDCAELSALLSMLAVLVFGRIVTDQFPTAYYYLDRISEFFSGFIGSIGGIDYSFGPVSAGIGLFLSFFIFSVLHMRSTKSGGLGRAFGYFVLYLITAGFGMLILTPIAIFVKQRFPSLDIIYLNPQLIYFALYLLPLFVVLGWRNPGAGCGPVPEAEESRPAGITAASPSQFIPRRWFSGKIAVVFLVLLVLSTVVSLPDFEKDGPKRVILFDDGYMNWRTPTFESFGGKSGGMFGNLPAFLGVTGYTPEKTATLDGQSLNGAGCLVVINLIRYFDENEKRAILDYVRNGGSLLILGDHTGVMGIRGPFNDLLENTGIRFNFDSASFFGEGWGDALRLWPGAMNRNLSGDDKLQIWVGASLTVKPPARYSAVASYGYSDIGDAANKDGAFLGDRKHNPGEKLGDIPLVAWTKFGKGKIVVYGDTSPFQNGALVTSHAYVERVFGWLTHRRTFDLFPFKVAAIAVLSLFVFSLYSPGILMSAGLLFSLVVGYGLGSSAVRDYAKGESGPNIALMDTGHANKFDRLGWYANSVGGLEYNLMRNGYLPFAVDKFSKERLERARLVVLVAPLRRYSKDEISSIERFVNNGGRLLVSVGYDESEPSRGLLSRFGIEIGGTPLAHLEVDEWGEKIQFDEAWPVQASAPFRPIVSKWGFPVVIEKDFGKGKVVVIGDSGFPLGRNLEEYQTVNVSNINFLRKIIQEMGPVK